MSHIVTITIEVRDLAALSAACRRLNLPAPVQGTHDVFGQIVEGHGVQLPDWDYLVVFNLGTGKGVYDNYGGKWGKQEHLDSFMQAYGVEKTKLELRRKGYRPTEQTRADGSIVVSCAV